MSMPPEVPNREYRGMHSMAPRPVLLLLLPLLLPWLLPPPPPPLPLPLLRSLCVPCLAHLLALQGPLLTPTLQRRLHQPLPPRRPPLLPPWRRRPFLPRTCPHPPLQLPKRFLLPPPPRRRRSLPPQRLPLPSLFTPSLSPPSLPLPRLRLPQQPCLRSPPQPRHNGQMPRRRVADTTLGAAAYPAAASPLCSAAKQQALRPHPPHAHIHPPYRSRAPPPP